MAKPVDIDLPVEQLIEVIEKLRRRALDMAVHYRELAAREDDEARAYAAVVEHLRRAKRIAPG
jgi:hypothetical protein